MPRSLPDWCDTDAEARWYEGRLAEHEAEQDELRAESRGRRPRRCPECWGVGRHVASCPEG